MKNLFLRSRQLIKCIALLASLYGLTQHISAGPSVTVVCPAGKTTKSASLSLRYTEPATDWTTEALPVGNGRIGAMIFGGVGEDSIQFNDKTLWSGSTTSRGAYQNFGYVRLNFGAGGEVSDYRRELDIMNAVATVSYRKDGVSYKREYFASYPDDVIVVRLTADKKGQINLSLALDGTHLDEQKEVSDNELSFSGKLDLLSYAARLNIKNEGGTRVVDNEKIVVEHADAVTLLLGMGTNFSSSSSYLSEGDKWKTTIKNSVTQAAKKHYSELRNAHIKDYSRLFDRVYLELKGRETDKLYFQYGRYLMIASSRDGLDLPSNLQGLWNNSNTPPWEGDIHSNINVQMNYWPAEATNLAECHLPFIKYIYNESQVNGSWRKMAQEHGCKGWTMRTQNNIFGYSDWNWNRPANAWYCMHVWDKYLFNPEKEYLVNTAYPIMKSACEFWMDRLVQDKDGNWVAPDEWSPEHGPWENGVPYAQQLIADLFENTLAAGEELGADPEFQNVLKEKYNHLDKGLAIGSWGQLKEWKYTEDDSLDTHRHLSHLIALYPGDAISLFDNPEYAAAVKRSLDARADVGMGWSLTWKMALRARLLDGERAHALLVKAMEVVENVPGKFGIYKNLFNAGPFQIDGNFGAVGGMTEMLLQSQRDELFLLPAIPQVWKSGQVTGLRARGGFDVNMVWKEMKLASAEIKSHAGQVCRIRTTCPLKVLKCRYTSEKDKDGYYITVFQTEKNKSYTITTTHK